MGTAMNKTTRKRRKGGGSKRLTPLPRLRRQCDALWRSVILRNAVCAVCAGPPNQAHHIFRKERHGRFRFDLRNGLPLCSRDHLNERHDAAPVVIKAILYHGQSLFDLAREVEQSRGNGAYRWTRKELELIKAGLEQLKAHGPEEGA